MAYRDMDTKLPAVRPGAKTADDWEGWMDWDHDAKPETELHLDGSSPEERATPIEKPSTSSLSPQSLKKRKLSTDSGETLINAKTSPAEGKAVQDRSHSVVEKRYRENLNQKIFDLRECIPNLRSGGNIKESVTQKQNKATVLTEAIAYIHHLERRNAYLEEANDAMKEQMQRNERNRRTEVMAPEETVPQCQDGRMVEAATSREEAAGQKEPRGMIPVPEEMRRLRRNQNQEHYADRICRDSENTSAGGVHIKGGKYIGRMVVGSLAGFMILDGFATPQSRVEKRTDKGLSALPMPHLLPTARRMIANYLTMPFFKSSSLFSPFVRTFLVFSVMGFALFLYLYYSKPPSRKSKKEANLHCVPSFASPLEVRQNAWLTSIQTVWVPRHNMLPEMLALILETAAYLTRQLLGWRCYSWLTGRSEEEEVARVRAWEIALDSQLCGGDPEVSKSRLVLTLWAAGTLPNTPSRLMLKALHIRVLFWQPSRFHFVCRVMHNAAMVLARYQWKKASRMQMKTQDISKSFAVGDGEPLADHLEALLQQSADDVLNDTFIQRNHNVVWNRPNDDLPQDGAEGVDNVIDDSAMRGPLDALASWFSSSMLQQELQKAIETAHSSSKITISQIDLAIETAPPGSLTRLRALAAKAVFSETDREACYKELTQSSPPSSIPGKPSVSSPFGIADSNPSAVDVSITIASSCALALMHLESTANIAGVSQQTSTFLGLVCHKSEDAGLLGYATAHHTLRSISNRLYGSGDTHLPALSDDVMDILDQLLAKPAKTTVEAGARKVVYRDLHRLVEGKKPSHRRTSGASLDTGYGSMSDDELSQ